MSSLNQRASALLLLSLAFVLSAQALKASTDWHMSVVAHCSSQPTEAQLKQIRTYLEKVSITIQRHWFPPKDGHSCMVKFVIDSAGITQNTDIYRHAEPISEQAAIRAVEKSAPYFPALDAPLKSAEIKYPFAFTDVKPTISIVVDKAVDVTKSEQPPQ